MAGDCYEANGRWMIGKDDSYRLVHGVAILPRDGKPFGHCWIERGSQVMDYSNGKDIKISKNSQFMLCGNPNMIKDSISSLKSKGIEINRKSAPGNITLEKYW